MNRYTKLHEWWDDNDRDWQGVDMIYTLPDGRAFHTPDGEGRIWYDTIDDAVDELGDDVPVIDLYADEPLTNDK